MPVETFSLLNIVESGKYSRGNSDSKPGLQAPYSAGCCSIVIAHAPVVGSFQQHLHSWHSRAGGGAVDSINSGHSRIDLCEAERPPRGVSPKSASCAQGTRFDMAVTDIAGRSAASAMARPRPLAMQE